MPDVMNGKKKKKKKMNRGIIVLLFLFLYMPRLTAQADSPPFRVMCWNVENLFDTHHDSLKNDYEFLPDALRHWNYQRYKKKLVNIARVITAVGEWVPPVLVGLCEVENDNVMRDLTRYSPLKEQGYRYVITHSPDERGIDVALLYQRDRFKYYPTVPSRPVLLDRRTAQHETSSMFADYSPQETVWMY